MTKPNYTHLEVLIDASGSMEPLATETVSGVNKLLADHQMAPGKATVAISCFNTTRWFLREKQDVKKVANIEPDDYRPNGFTALLDAMCGVIDNLGQRLNLTAEEARPSKVIFIVITDGLENMSTWATRRDVEKRVTHQREKYGWEFLFLGANMDAFAEAEKLGIPQNYASTWNSTSKGLSETYTIASNASVRGRYGSANLTPDEQKKMGETK